MLEEKKEEAIAYLNDYYNDYLVDRNEVEKFLKALLYLYSDVLHYNLNLELEYFYRYEENIKKISSYNNLEDLKNKINAGLENITDKNIITFHEAFPYFAKEFGLNIVGVINQEPGEEPTVKEIKGTIDLIKTKNVKCIFTEPQYPENTAKTIASETGVSVYALDPAVTGDGSADSYLNAMEKNLEVLEKALR